MTIKHQTKLQTFTQNQKGRDFIVGDIHGHHTLLTEKLSSIKFDTKNDRLFSVGDLIDRGPENEKCLDLIYEDWFFPVIGNHELLMLEGILLKDTELWFENGGDWILRSDLFGDDIRMFAEEINNFLPFAIEITDGNKTFGIVHAEPYKNWNVIRDFCAKEHSALILLEKKLPSKKELNVFFQMTWGRTRHDYQQQHIVENIDRVYVGHNIVQKPLDLGNVRYLDTGAYRTQSITIEEIIF